MSLVIHHLRPSQAERIPWLCEELGIPYELVFYQREPLWAGADLKALHPLGAAPVVHDKSNKGADGSPLMLAESGACMEYIAHTHADGRLFVKPGQPGYVDFIYFWHWANSTYQANMLRLLSLRLAGLREEDGNKDALAAADARDRSLAMLDARLAKTKGWLVGPREEDFSAADIMVLFSLTTERYFLPYSLAKYPHVVDYLGRIGKRPAYQRAMAKTDPDLERGPTLTAEGPKPMF